MPLGRGVAKCPDKFFLKGLRKKKGESLRYKVCSGPKKAVLA
jgi:hypothetical protein